MVSELLGKMKISFVEFSGRLTEKAQFRSLALFEAASGPQVFLATPGTGSEGLTLNVAKAQVFFGLGYDYDKYKQALGRNHRVGQADKVVVYQFICEGTIDEEIRENLKRKGKLSDLLLNRNKRQGRK
jgi:SNF2 family DNA or RNA helicase